MNTLTKALNRFIVIYFLIYIFPFPLDYIPFVGKYIDNTVQYFWDWILPIVYEDVLGFEDKLVLEPTGSGDRKVDYLFLMVSFVLALLVTVGSLFFSLEKNKERKMFTYFIVTLRYFLAFTMFTYGFAKVFYLQFSQLSLYSLEQTFGNSSPMGILWRFMGYSEPYTVFTGILEVLGGIFLIWRRTKVLGAIMCFGIMLNVFVLNLSYDVPVKLFSFHLTLMSLVILMPDYKNLMKFFFKNSPSEPIIHQPYFNGKENEIIRLTVKFLLVGFVLFKGVKSGLERQAQYGKRVPEHSLYGVYEVHHFIKNGDTISSNDPIPIMGYPTKWKKLLIDKRDSRIVLVDEEQRAMKHELDTISKTFSMISYLDESLKYEFNYEQKGNWLYLNSEKGKDSLKINLLRKKREDYYLENRGFHWINDYPMNR